MSQLLSPEPVFLPPSSPTHLAFVPWWPNSQSLLWVRLTGKSLIHLQNSSWNRLGNSIFEKEYSFLFQISFVTLCFFAFHFLLPGRGLGWVLSKPVHDTDLEIRKLDDFQRSVSLEMSVGSEVQRKALGFSKRGDVWESKREKGTVPKILP